jgi:phage terminase large subunit-like protein
VLATHEEIAPGIAWLAHERPTLGPRVGAFCYHNVRQTKGRWAGHPLLFEEWQQAFLNEAFEVDPLTGLRIYTEVLLGIPRKNGKSTMASGLSLYLLVADGEAGPEVYNAAAAKDQARVVFQQAKQFVEASPTLEDFLLVKRSEIESPENMGVLRVLSSRSDLQHGSNPSGNVIDELWAHKTNDLYVALTTGTAAREHPFTLTITTAGFDEESPLGELYTKALKLEVERPTPFLTIARDRENGFLMYWYGVPEDSAYDVHDPEVVKQANPASWVTVPYLRREMNKPSMRFIEYRRWHANQWTAAEDAWVEGSVWDSCKAPQLQLRPELPIGAAVDMGEVYDSTGVVWAQRQRGLPCKNEACHVQVAPAVGRRKARFEWQHGQAGCTADRVVVRSKRWSNPYPPGHALREHWRVNTEEVRGHVRGLRERYPVAMAKRDKRTMPGPAVGYDPWHFRESAEMLEEEGLNMVEFPQNAARMGPASEQLLELVKAGRLAHNGDPQLRQAVTSAIAKRTRRGWVIDKPKGSTKLIDLAVACAMAVSMAMLEPPKPRERKPGRAVGF